MGGPVQAATTHVITPADTITIPGVAEPLSLLLPPGLTALREKALTLQRQPQPPIPEIRLADARAWSEHTDSEDWLVWRARRCAERLRAMPIDLEPGEGIVGKPLLRHPAPDEAPALQAAEKVLATIPPYPGGDAGHFHPDYEKLLTLGVSGIIREIQERSRRPDLTGEQRTFYEACRIVMEGLSTLIRRIADGCDAMCQRDPNDAPRWRTLSRVCRRVATERPVTFHEALQLLFAAEIALWFGEDHGLASPGRIDQTLRPFYDADLAAGRTTRQEAFELLCCLYIHMNRILWPGSAVAVMVGGRDRHGQDVTNDLTYLAMAARQATRLVYPTVGLVWHKGSPDALMNFAMRVLATGCGDPAFFNDDVISHGLRDHGASEPDSHNYVNSTCVEIKVAGASNIWVTCPYFNLPQGLLDVLNAVTAGTITEPTSFAELQEQVRQNLAGKVRAAAESADRVWQQRAKTGCFPLASCFIADCLDKGQDFDRGGARYNWVENSFVGLANLADSLLAVRNLVYERRELGLKEFQAILQRNYEGHEPLRQRILNLLPHYGNDNPEADSLAADWADFLIQTTEANTVGPHRYVPGFFCWIMHERLGSETGATPDGRLAHRPLADGAGAAQGREQNGPTASVLSTTAWNHRAVLGGLVHNLKLSKSLLTNASNLNAARRVIETYLRRGGFEIQVNVAGRETLLEAQAHPEQYQDLLVRVAGYSDYFVHLNRNMQDEVIARTEHEV
ncbi:MAG: hypothetical protein A3K19_32545 [Lentisphaerae bacterium RIFOXYB12_FULL_65_16]|nr:MAG: hypothetical protein A3K18_08020 [Lentisphaerae bacterium RIFOXYA12_64_32]OGV84427.1 MAG: hypothetical protein A3K19_32545 [Lentisphaerae bacterium RIFOXYB12_FULL_65_16]